MAEFLVRLRGTESGIVDLAGNTWENTGNVSKSTTGIVGNNAISVAQGKYLVTNSLSALGTDDFTFSAHVKLSSHGGNSGYWHCIWSQYANGTQNGFDISAYMLNQSLSGFTLYGGVNDIQSQSNINIVDNNSHHIALCRNADNFKYYIDGVLASSTSSGINLSGSLACIASTASSSVRGDTYVEGIIDDLCIIKGEALWTEDFTPPTKYLKLTSSCAYLSSNNLYTGASLTNLTTNWSGLTSAEKEVLVESFSDEIPSIQDLVTISPFRVLTDDTSPTNVKVTGQPKPQIIEPTSLINTGAVSTVQSINITNTITDAVVKFAITTDLTTYKVYDATQGDWVTSIDIEEDGMSIAQINALTPQILSQLDISNGIAFKQCFIATSENASAELSEISAVVDIDGSWSQSVHGTDYNVTYPNKTTMSVRLLTNGDYIINYPISSNS